MPSPCSIFLNKYNEENRATTAKYKNWDADLSMDPKFGTNWTSEKSSIKIQLDKFVLFME
jgi:hypothetical protein